MTKPTADVGTSTVAQSPRAAISSKSSVPRWLPRCAMVTRTQSFASSRLYSEPLISTVFFVMCISITHPLKSASRRIVLPPRP